MSTETKSHESRQQSNGNGKSHGEAQAGAPGFVGRATKTLFDFPLVVKAQMQERPLTTVGLAVAAGAGAGMILGSRVLRAVLVTALGQTAVELAREYLRRQGRPVSTGYATSRSVGEA